MRQEHSSSRKKMSESQKKGEGVTAGRGERLSQHEMKQKLSDIGMFEEGMSYDDMACTLKVVQESRKTALSKAPSTPETKVHSPKTSISPTLTPPNPMSYSFVASSTQSAVSERKSMSPELQSSHHSASNYFEDKQSGSQEEKMFSPNARNPFSQESRDSPSSNANKNRSSNLENSSQTIMSDNKRANNKGNYNARQEEKNIRLRIGVLDMSVKRNDAALQPRYRTDNQDSGEGSSSAKIDNIDKAIAQLSKHLHLVAEISSNYLRGHVDTNFQWGSAIKVGTMNGSLDKKIIANKSADREFQENIDSPEKIFTVGTSETTRERRSCSTTKLMIFDYTDDESDGDDEKKDSDEDFQIEKKRKKTAHTPKTINAPRSTRQKSVEPAATNDAKVEESKEIERNEESFDPIDDNVSTDDEASNQPPKKLPRNASPGIARSLFPRRIEPPKPAGQRWASFKRGKPTKSKNKKSSEDENNEENVSSSVQKSRDSRSGLKDSEIAEELEKMEDDDDKKEAIAPICDPDIRPLRISTRMKLACQNLAQTHEHERERENIRREEERRKIEAEEREKRERVSKRIREENERMKQRDEVEKARIQREENWKIMTALREKKKVVERTELHPDGRPRDAMDEVPASSTNGDFSTANENMDDYVEKTPADAQIVRVSCPICNREFPIKEIEAHAGACEEFDTVVTPNSSPTHSRLVSPERTNNSTLLRCEICDKFSTHNGQQYRLHVDECILKKKHGCLTVADSSGARIVVSTSPYRSLRTISELKDSEIDFKNQFAPTKKTSVNTTRKRKR